MNLDGFRSNCSDWHVGCWGQWCGSGHYFGGSSVCRILSFFFGASVFRQSRWLEAKQILYLFFSVIFFFDWARAWELRQQKALRDSLSFVFWVGHSRWALGPSWIFKAFILEFGVQVLAYRRRCAWTKMPIRDGLVGWVVEKMETCDMTLE